MQNYRGNTSDYTRRGRCGNTAVPAPMPCPTYQQSESCCTHKDDVLDGMPIAMAYVPWQTWQCPYEAEKALQHGTIFEELDKPFRGMRGNCR